MLLQNPSLLWGEMVAVNRLTGGAITPASRVYSAVRVFGARLGGKPFGESAGSSGWSLVGM